MYWDPRSKTEETETRNHKSETTGHAPHTVYLVQYDMHHIQCILGHTWNEKDLLAESKTRTYHGRDDLGRTAGWRGAVGQEWVPRELFA